MGTLLLGGLYIICCFFFIASLGAVIDLWWDQ